ncbi:ATP-binding cassette domain-containing protein [Pseudoalteromonas sp. A41-2]
MLGRNGSGKSTIEKLILGLYEPTAGTISIDNNDIHQIDPRRA